MATGLRNPQLTPMTMDPKSREAEYAVRGAVALKAMDVQAKLRSGVSFPFKNLISCNIGNPQALGQQPITFIRQVGAACTHPPLMDIPGLFPSDVIARAKAYVANTDRGCGMGAYTDTHGLCLVKDEVASFIAQRDGYPCNPCELALSTGASEGVRRVIQALIAGPKDGIMISAPQYPLYTCAIAMCGGQTVFYELDEESGWSVTEAELVRSYEEALKKGINVRGLVVINPGNPVGSVLDEPTIRMIIKFANRRNLLLFADEVYQANVYSKKFFSFKKGLRDLEAEDSVLLPNQQLVSFHTVSKGLVGECGQRGGYVEYVGFGADMLGEMRKIAASSLSPCTLGQVIVGLMVNPPQLGDPSFSLFDAESTAIFNSLKRRAVKLCTELNKMEGIVCQPVEGAMYAFPQIQMPPRAIAEAHRRRISPDEMYCLDMVEEAGIVTVPGSGFGQKKDTYHFRTTILPSEEEIDQVVVRLGEFQKNFLRKWTKGTVSDHVMESH